MAIKGLVFDFDGLILDTELPEFESWCMVFREYGQELTLSDWAVSIGVALDTYNPADYLEELIHQKLDRVALFQHRMEFARERFMRLLPLPGIIDTLQAARNLNLKTAIASSSDCEWVVGHIERLGLRPYFECIRTREDVLEAKPAPDLFLSACRCIGLQPCEVIVFEDSPNGITAARTAGCNCVAIPNELTRQLDTSHANLVINSLSETPLEQLLTHFNQNS